MRSPAARLLIRTSLVPVRPRRLAVFTTPWCDRTVAPVVQTGGRLGVSATIPAPVPFVPEALRSLAAAGTAMGCPYGRQAGPLLCTKCLIVCNGCCTPRLGHLLASRRIWLVALAIVRLPW